MQRQAKRKLRIFATNIGTDRAHDSMTDDNKAGRTPILRKMFFSARTYGRALALLCIFQANIFLLRAEGTDTLRRWGLSLSAMPGKVLATDSYVKKWLHEKKCFSIAAELTHTALPCDSDDFAHDYNYPTLGLGARFAFNHKVTMRRYADPDWGKLLPVDFDSRLGNTFSVFINFHRPLWLTRRFECGYSLGSGIGYSRYKYDKETAPDNELIGSHWLIYFAASLYASWRFADDWALRGSMDFYHHSNGALNRPNKGSNTAGPSLGLIYIPYYKHIADKSERGGKKRFPKYFYLNFTAGFGGKAPLEDWQLTQFNTAPDDPSYRTGHFHFYTAWSFQTDLMYRYARRWASGLGLDVFYGSYASHVESLDAAQGSTLRHSPWSVGVAAKHQVYYHNLSVAMSLGFYLFRHMGEQAQIIETPYYERIGLHYTFPKLNGLELGVNVKAHKTKADLTEFVVSMPLRL